MSVINQMLKDLEKRSDDNRDVSTAAGPVTPQAKNKTSMALITVVVSVLLTLVLVAVVFLFQENQLLRQQASTGDKVLWQNQQAQQLVAAVEKIAQQSAAVNETVDDLEQRSLEQKLERKTVQKTAQQPANEAEIADVNSDTERTQNDATAADITPEKVQTTTQVSTSTFTESRRPLASANHHVASTELMRDTQLSTSRQMQKPNETTTPTDTTNLRSISSESSPSPEHSQPNAVKPSLTIARKQLSSAQLAAQKINQAEQAMAAQQGEQAEQLLQDALLLVPNNKQARKQLAAIWFARGNNQAAVNLLNQGISLSPLESDFRLMKGKILLQGYQRSQFQNPAQDSPLLTQAYDTLVAQPDVSQVEYQALLASVAQQLNQLPAATNAYQQLVTLQPNQAKWQLGLATVLDQASRFNNALAAYQQALAIGGLSTQSRQFAEQRIKELGE
ncbi:hypothetical protein DXX93_17425 [Thalassotalea euphylliae]|uniref:Uncharacterized protein n=1 Tax=Thalassotalea euphylliae TaxID=1655234 RepID=A0A3E0TUC6_9GAMM|nr:tetratricopeptide repeat protein [Thalassotalea euphylliae]REL28168.1 hypothetical protein DXX93_17425 [Thalassotalea euphylliae]